MNKHVYLGHEQSARTLHLKSAVPHIRQRIGAVERALRVVHKGIDDRSHLSRSRSSLRAAWIAAATFMVKATFAAGVRSSVAPISSANIIFAASIASAARSVAVLTTVSIRDIGCLVVPARTPVAQYA